MKVGYVKLNAKYIEHDLNKIKKKHTQKNPEINV